MPSRDQLERSDGEHRAMLVAAKNILGPRYRSYMLGLLLFIAAHNFIDRIVLGLLLQDIKADLQLSDTQLGLLTGIAFALFYSVLGIPIARYADRGNRIGLIAATTAIWSLAVALCGFAQNFVQMLAARVLVSIGEAGCLPPAHSLIGDHYQRGERARALAIYMLAPSIAMAIGFAGAGWLNTHVGWRMTFVIIGLPGLIFALIAFLTLHEPRQHTGTGHPDQIPQPPVKPVELGVVLHSLWSNKTYRHLVICLSVSSLFGSGLLVWKPTYFIRSFHLDTAVVGAWFALVYGIGGSLGTYLGGALASKYAPNDEARQLKALSLIYIAYGILQASIFLAPNLYAALLALMLAIFGSALIIAPIFAIIQMVVPDHMRAVAVATTYFFMNLIGMGLGPVIAGGLSDALHAALGPESLRWALIALCPAYLWSSWHAWRGSQTVSADLDARLAEQA